MRKADRIRSALLLAAGLAAGLLALPAHATDLRPEANRAFDRYVKVLETRMESDVSSGNFLYLDNLPSGARPRIVALIRHGDFYIEQPAIQDDGLPIHVPYGLIHHWIGIEFMPGATYPQTLKILLDFDKQAEIYKPDVRRSKVLESDGNKSRIHLQYFKKSLVSVVLNADFETEYRPLGGLRGEIRSHSTRIAEVQNSDAPDGKELPVGKDHGYLWRLDSYWRIEEKDGGVYLEIETVGLSRRVPPLFAWLINPTVRSLSRSVMGGLLTATRKAVIANAARGARS